MVDVHTETVLYPEGVIRQTKSLSVPVRTYGMFYFVIQTDVFHNIYEHIRESNNIGATEVRALYLYNT